MESLRFLTADDVRKLAAEFGTPFFVYNEATLRQRAGEVLDFPNAFGLTARYAMKALPTAAVVQVFADAGLHIDASSGYEAERAMRAGVAPENGTVHAGRRNVSVVPSSSLVVMRRSPCCTPAIRRAE